MPPWWQLSQMNEGTTHFYACFYAFMPLLQSNRFGLSRGKDAKKAAANAADAEPATPDFSAKLLHLAWHPQAPLIAAAGAECSC